MWSSNSILIAFAALGLTASSAFADPAKSLIGKTDFDVVSCAGAPESVIDFTAGRQVMTFTASRRSGGLFANNSGLFGHKSESSCQAIVQLQDGVVTRVEYKKVGGLLSTAMLCGQVLAGCE